jgi:D-alanine transaminase
MAQKTTPAHRSLRKPRTAPAAPARTPASPAPESHPSPMQNNDETIVYFNGQFLRKKDVRISPDDRGFLFGDGVYEVVRVYDGRLFEAEAHWKRLARSLRALRIDGPDPAAFADVARQLLADNDLQDAALYIQITRGAAPRKHYFPDPAIAPTVYASVFQPQLSRAKWSEGVKVILVPDMRWARCDIKTVALPPNVLASQRAREADVEEAVFVRDGALTEGSHTNVCAVFGGELVTYPKTPYILPGVTRDVVLDLCRQLGIPYREEAIFEHELGEADELMILGTTTEVMPVVQADHRTIGDGRPGPVTLRLQRAFCEYANR